MCSVLSEDLSIQYLIGKNDAEKRCEEKNKKICIKGGKWIFPQKLTKCKHLSL